MLPTEYKLFHIDPASVRTLIVDDSELVLSSIRSYLEEVPGIMVVATATSGQQALRLVRLHRPELVLLDIHMPGMNGFETATRITCEFPATCVVHISAWDGYEYEQASQRSGARSLLGKSKLVVELPRLVERLFGSCETSPAAELLHVAARNAGRPPQTGLQHRDYLANASFSVHARSPQPAHPCNAPTRG